MPLLFHIHELFEIDLAVAVNISFPDHLVNILVRELLAEVSHYMSQLSSRNETVAVHIVNFEDLKDILEI